MQIIAEVTGLVNEQFKPFTKFYKRLVKKIKRADHANGLLFVDSAILLLYKNPILLKGSGLLIACCAAGLCAVRTVCTSSTVG